MDTVKLNEEELTKKHKQERKDLQSRIQSLKKTITKGDKKKKREVTEEIVRLEKDLDDRQSSEVEALSSSSSNVSHVENLEEPTNEEVNNVEESPNTATRVSRATRRRNKKALEEKEREKRIREQSEKNREGPRMTEMNAMKEVLKHLGLQLHNIPADGNCLYCAVNHQLELAGQETFAIPKLRKLTVDFMRQHKDDFLPFMYDNDSDEPVSEEYFEAYCKEMATTKLWGGQLELRALSNILSCPIKVVQANGPPTVLGENFKGPELTLAYHRHLYRLGEHYNSTVVDADREANA